MLQNVRCFVHFALQMCFAPQRRASFWTSKLQKVARECGVLCILTCKCASRHSRVAFWNIWTSKMAPALTFDLQNSRVASELPKWLRRWGVLYILTCKCASRHSRVAFWNIWTSKMAPTLRCFVHFDLQMCFAPQPRAIFHTSAEHLPPHPPL